LIAPAPKLLALCAPPANWSGASRVVSGWAATPTTKTVECVGKAYQQRLRASLVGNAQYEAAVSAVKAASAAAEAEAAEASEKKKKSKKKGPKFHTIDDNIDEGNYYTLLCLPNRENTPHDVIRENHRQLCLLYHPDKAPEEKRERQEKRYVAIQIAFETLLDETKRRAYESSLDFDDSYPDTDEGLGDEFYAVYGPVFKRNARFSETPVPELGGPDMHIDQVNEFYDAWYAFKSWRDFKVKGDHDVSKAEGRDEKRWMEKENDKLKNRLRKEEGQRIRVFVDQAFKIDPRIIKWRKEEKARKIAEQEAKEYARGAKQREAEAAAKAAQEAKEAAERAAKEQAELNKKAKEEEKGRQKKLRSAMRKVSECQFFGDYLAEDIIEEFSKKLTLDETTQMLQLFTDALPHCGIDTDPAVTGAAPEVQAALAAFQKHYGESKRQITEIERAANAIKAKQRAEAAAKQKQIEERKIWTRDELSLLAKATTKHPPGTRNRWEVIAAFIGTRTAEEVLAKTKDLQANSEASAVASKVQPEDAFQSFQAHKRALKPDEAKRMADAVEPAAASTAAVAAAAATAAPAAEEKKEEAPSAPWTPADQAAFEAAMRKFPSTVEGRWDLISKELGTRTKKECMQRFKELKKTGEIAPEAPAPAAAPAAPVAAAKPKKEKEEKKPAAPKVEEVDKDGWTTKQQVAFEEALKKYPAGIDARWEMVSAAVPGRTQKECVARFKDIRTKLMAEKLAAQGGASASS
jgi:DnaJ family protein C protein 2